MPNTEYVLTLQDTRQVFTTGDTVDESAPVLPAVTVAKASTREWRLNIRNESRVVSVVGSEVRALSTNCRGFFLPASKTFDVDAQVMDLAGNVSNTTSVRHVEGVSVCASTPAGALVLLAVVARLRRYRSPRSGAQARKTCPHVMLRIRACSFATGQGCSAPTVGLRGVERSISEGPFGTAVTRRHPSPRSAHARERRRRDDPRDQLQLLFKTRRRATSWAARRTATSSSWATPAGPTSSRWLAMRSS